ncbi:MAG: DUF1080 domain-containing protein [Bacteroidota bacterium]
MKKINLLLIALISWNYASSQITDPKATEVWDPEPRVIDPGDHQRPPSDAIVLFDGTNLDQWMADDSTAAKWTIEDGHMTVKPGGGGVTTKESFGDIQLHIEWRSPEVVLKEGQLRGNSGVFLQSRYEVQVLDSYNNRTYANGQAGSVYKQYIPLVNASRKPGEWETYDIIFKAPRFNEDGIRVAAGRLTVLHNGILIQNNVEIQGTTEYIGLPKNKAHGNAPIYLQDHGDLVSYRNIWVRKL